MTIEDRLRRAKTDELDRFSPAPDAWDRVRGRIEARPRRRFVPIALAAAISVALIAGLVVPRLVERAPLPDPLVSRITSATRASGTFGYRIINQTGTITAEVDLRRSLTHVIQEFGAASQPCEMLGTRTAIYYRIDERIIVRKDGRSWLRVARSEIAEDQPSPRAVDPDSLVDSLGGIGKLRPLGREDVGGVPTTHYRGIWRLSRFLAHASPSKQEAVQREVARNGSPTSWPVDIWLDDQRLVRKQHLDFTARAIGGGQVRTVQTIEFFDYGADLGLREPPRRDTVEATRDTRHVAPCAPRLKGEELRPRDGTG